MVNIDLAKITFTNIYLDNVKFILISHVSLPTEILPLNKLFLSRFILTATELANGFVLLVEA